MKRLFSINGRADIFEWWAVSIVADLVAQLGGIFAVIQYVSDEDGRLWIAAGLAICALAAVWTSIAVTVRRLRDRGRPPWTVFLGLVPVAGWIWLLVECGFLPAPRTGPKRVLTRRIVRAGEEP